MPQKTTAKFGTVINCIDGRVQAPVADWMKKQFKLQYVDVVTEPGPDKFVSSAAKASTLDGLEGKVLVSIGAHHSNVVGIVGHAGCAGNPVDKKTHWKEIQEAVQVIANWKLPITVVGLWVGEDSKVEQVAIVTNPTRP